MKKTVKILAITMIALLVLCALASCNFRDGGATVSPTPNEGVSGDCSHEWADGGIKTAPRCEKDGVKLVKCALCGQTKEEPIAATGHQLDGSFNCSKCDFKGTKLNYEESGSTYVISGISGNDDKLYIAYTEGVKGGSSYKVTTVKNGAFKGNTNVKEVYFGEGITYIGESAFEGCTALEKVSLPSTVKSIGVKAFKDCTALKEVTIAAPGENATLNIYSEAFEGCDALSKLVLPEVKGQIAPDFIDTDAPALELADGVYYLGPWAVRQAENTENVVLREGTKYFTRGFIEADDKTVTMAKGMTLDSRFNGGAEIPATLEELILPADITKLGNIILPGVKRLAIPESVTEIGDIQCASITELIIPDSVKTVGKITNCTNLLKITVGSGVETMWKPDEGDVWTPRCEGCDSLAEVFSRSANINSSYFPSTVNFYTPTQGESTLDFDTVKDYVFMEEMGTAYLVKYTGNATELTLPANYKGGAYDIFKYAFANNDKLTAITLPEGVKVIGAGAFSGCDGLVSITVPASVTTLMQYAFTQCTGLESISFANGSALESIGQECFSHCSALKEFRMPGTVKVVGSAAFHNCTALEVISLSGQLRAIPESMLHSCRSLRYVVIPTSVRSVGWNAFYQCGGKKFYPGHQSSFNSLVTLEKNCGLSASYITFYLSQNAPTNIIGERGWYYDANGVPTAWPND